MINDETTSQERLMGTTIEHLSDGEPVALPYAYAGHYSRESDAASPMITVVYGVLPGGHPYRPASELLLAKTEDHGLVAVAADRMAHLGDCEQCAPTWERYRQMLVGLPADVAITGGVEIETSRGTGLLLIDAEDLPDEEFSNEPGQEAG